MSIEDTVRMIITRPEEIVRVQPPAIFHVLGQLAATQPMPFVVAAIGHSPMSNELLHYLADDLKPQNKWQTAVDAIASHADANVRSGKWSRETVLDVLSDPQSLAHLAANYRRHITNPSHVLYPVNLNPHWNAQVGRFITKGDLARAWDELIKAVRGIAADHRVQSPHLHQISPQYVRPLVRRIFEALLAKELVEPVTQGDCDLRWWQLYSACIGGTRSGRRPIQSPRARGMEFRIVQMMGSAERLTREGVMVFRIGECFRKLRQCPRPHRSPRPNRRRQTHHRRV